MASVMSSTWIEFASIEPFETVKPKRLMGASSEISTTKFRLKLKGKDARCDYFQVSTDMLYL